MIRKMTVALMMLALLAGPAVFSSAQNKQAKKEAAPNEHVVAALDAYVAIHDALAADKTDGVRANAAAIVKSADAALKLSVKDTDGEKNLTGSLTSLKEQAAKLDIEGLTIEVARKHFGPLSEAAVRIVKELPAEAAAKYDIFYCPMAKGQWIQKGDTASNPYYGSEMPKCGKKVGPGEKAGCGDCKCKTCKCGDKKDCGKCPHAAEKCSRGANKGHKM